MLLTGWSTDETKRKTISLAGESHLACQQKSTENIDEMDALGETYEPRGRQPPSPFPLLDQCIQLSV